ncbi:MAG: sugar ABC transporter ATP-binding protein, partial [Betaproteobacteria bacterium]|nr:sugar ABC transporter ATP-binding protein [Betaproteobacteria bacterium]
VHVKTEAGDLVALFRERRSFSVGEVIGLCSAPALLHLFDSIGGGRLNARPSDA